MTAPNKRAPAPLASRILGLVGTILVLSFFLDLLVNLGAPQLDSDEWQLSLMDELMSRGVIPLIGFALLYAGAWMNRTATRSANGQTNISPWQDSRFWIFVLSILLGLIFLVMPFFHYTKTTTLTKKVLEQVDQQAEQRGKLLQQDLKQVQQRQQLWEAIQKDPKQLDQLIQNPQLPAQEKVALQQMKQDSNSLNENIQEQLTQLQQIKTQLDQQEQTLKTEKQEAINDTKIKALIKNIRAFLRSILLAVGFVSIGWLGQRESR